MAQPPHEQLDHLVPEPGEMAQLTGRDFSFGIAKYLAGALPKDARVFALIQMGWFPPVAISLGEISGGYELSGAEVNHKPGTAWNTVQPKEPLNSCTTRIDRVVGDRIIAVWDQMVLQTHDGGGGLPLHPDGAAGFYASRFGNRIVSGWSGSNEGNPKHLFEIAFRLSELCLNGTESDTGIWAKIDGEITAIR
ncbi:MAG: hypothetical protein JO256_06970 [Alphaproteobacteria bacterium]|nr:hypothetical protein [Alphaproteobacteria bacterium]